MFVVHWTRRCYVPNYRIFTLALPSIGKAKIRPSRQLTAGRDAKLGRNGPWPRRTNPQKTGIKFNTIESANFSARVLRRASSEDLQSCTHNRNRTVGYCVVVPCKSEEWPTVRLCFTPASTDSRIEPCRYLTTGGTACFCVFCTGRKSSAPRKPHLLLTALTADTARSQ